MPVPDPAAPASLEAQIDGLYGLPLAEFIGARNALAARLKKEGAAEQAARVKALAKPPLPAWAVNQLARRRGDVMEALFAAGDAVRAAQRTALERGDGEPLRTAVAAQRDVLARAGRAAATLLAEAGHAAAAGTLDRVAATLRALAGDPDGRARLGAGCLAQELEPPGFEALAALDGVTAVAPRPPQARPAPPAPDRAAGAAPASAAATDEAAQRRAQVAQVRERVAEAAREARALVEALEIAERAAVAARRAAGEADEAAERARAQVARANERLERARAAAAAAEAELRGDS
ncbi:MAG TPA: hypothetical protein VG389_20460 [Myxococcota bacterium]|jgi:hypothetical protein|nr:hypothetical protein [Myxococcota bacterium]